MGEKRYADKNGRGDEKRNDNQFEEVFHVHTIPHYLLYRKLFLHVLDGAIALYNLRHNLLNTNELRRRGGGSLVTPLRLRSYKVFVFYPLIAKWVKTAMPIITADEMMNGMTMSSMMSFMCILYHSFSFIARNYCVDYMARLRSAIANSIKGWVFWNVVTAIIMRKPRGGQ